MRPAGSTDVRISVPSVWRSTAYVSVRSSASARAIVQPLVTSVLVRVLLPPAGSALETTRPYSSYV